MFWVLVTFSLVCADKLDRNYLPPPGTEYSGGRPEDIQVSLEHPKLEHPTNNDFIDNTQLTVGIDRVGSNQVSDAQNELKNTSPVIDNIITQNKPNNSDETYFTSSIGSDYTPNYSNSESPIIQNIYKDRDQNQNNNRLPANRILDGPNYPSHFETDTKSLFPTTVQAQTIEEANDVIYVPCNRSLPIDSINNSCEINNNGNQYFSTLSPTIYPSTTSSPSPVTSKFTDFSNPSKLPNFINTATSTFYSSTTKNPLNKNSLKFEVTANRPERIQAQADREAYIVNYENLWTPEGYAYSYDTSNGIHGDESAIAVNGVRAKGSYSYIGDDGKRYSIVYTADENGFQPQGDHLPTPPPIPDAILKVIEKAYEDKKAGIFDDGSYDESKYGYKKYQKSPYKQNLFNHIRGQENKIDRLNLRNNNIPIQETGHSESLTKIIPSNYSKNISELNKNIKEIKDKSEKLKEEFFKDPSIQGNTYENTNSSLITKLTPLTEKGDKYFSRQNEEAKEFPPRFSEMKGLINDNQQVNATPKPFLTPYVSRNNNEGDEEEMSDSYEKIFAKPGQFFNDSSQQNYYNSEYQGEDNLRKKVNFPDISGKSDSFKLTNNGYFYPKVMDSEEALFSQHSNPYLPVSSNGPFDFSTRSTIPKFDQYYSSTPQSTPAPNTPAIREKENENLIPTLLPNYSTTNLDFVNEYGNTNIPIINNFNNINGSNKENMEIINTSKFVSTSRPDIPKLKASYSPNIDLMITNYDTVPSTTEKNIQEDFSGPKRPHSFDTLTGYHY